MSKKFMTGAVLALAAAALTAVGCEAKPHSVRRVDPSVLPASVKGQFQSGAQIDRVEELTYSKGAKQYRVSYTMDGKKRQALFSTADETRPTGVFEHVN